MTLSAPWLAQFGGATALLLAVVLPLLPRRHRFANLFLSGLLACVGGWLLLIATTSNQFQLGNQTLYLGISLSYLMGPFLLCYVQATLQPEFRLHSRMLGYPMPMIMAMAISYPVLLELASDQSILFTHQGSAGLRFVMGMGLMGFVSLTIFCLRVIQISRRAYPKLPESGSLRWRYHTILLSNLLLLLAIPATAILETQRLVLQHSVGELSLWAIAPLTSAILLFAASGAIPHVSLPRSDDSETRAPAD